jgi:cytochrome b561
VSLTKTINIEGAMSTQNSYHRVSRLLHWTLAILIVGMLAIGLLMGNIPNANLGFKVMVYNWHKTIGLLILTLSVFRLIWRLTHKPPALPAAMKSWEKLVTRVVHSAFYAFMIVMPLVGWSIISTSKFPSKFFNSALTIPKLPFWHDMTAEAQKGAHEFFEETHEIMAFLAIALIALHVAAALKHHFVAKDDVLVQMMPSLRKNASSKSEDT